MSDQTVIMNDIDALMRLTIREVKGEFSSPIRAASRNIFASKIVHRNYHIVQGIAMFILQNLKF